MWLERVGNGGASGGERIGTGGERWVRERRKKGVRRMLSLGLIVYLIGYVLLTQGKNDQVFHCA